MCWLLVIFTALLCTEISQARPRGSGKEVLDHETQIQEGNGPQIQEGNGPQIQEGNGPQIQEDNGAQIQEELKEALKELELAERLAEAANSREARGLLKKVAFLAGMKVGGFVQSSGTLAASNSLRFFGKVVNSALSVSYGTIDELNYVPGIDSGTPILVEHPVEEEHASTKVISVEGKPATKSVRETEEEAHRKIKANFLTSHNELVERANANSKFLRTSRAQDLNKSTETRL